MSYYFEPEWKVRKKLHRRITAIISVWYICAVLIVVYSCSGNEPVEPAKLSMLPSHEPNAMVGSVTGKYLKLTSYFRKHKNKHPEMSASAVLETKRPKLMASLAIKGEKNTPYTAKRTGYKKRHSGMFQVSEKDWGYAGTLPIDQALKSERVLDEFIASYGGSMQKGLNAYGGDKTKNQYAKNILNELQKSY